MTERRRYVLTGAPGAGKTTLIDALRQRGHLVFLIGPLGFVTRTAARRISYAESLAFAKVHERVYEAYGHRLVDVPVGPVHERVALIEKHLTPIEGTPRFPNFT
ncbi:AAA family ATPase [Micromonospora sp. NPDC047467]|uniref:AAA family ATPase n=1 Tax=Micromonospora sp. NPDC047467 TaxID=3154814 RepID=UPI003408FCCE